MYVHIQVFFKDISASFYITASRPTSNETTKSFQALSHSIEKASIMAGIAVSIEKDFVTNGYDEIMMLNKQLISALGHSKPCLLLGYSVLMYFTNKVCFACKVQYSLIICSIQKY